MNRILVIRGGAIGDFVLTLPAIKLLRDNYPDSHLEILGYKHIVALAEGRFYAQAVHSIEYAALASFFARGADLPNELCNYFKNFDLVVSYLFDPDRIFEQNLDRAGVDLFLACSPKISEGEPAAKQLARALAQLDLELTEEPSRIFPSPEDRAFAGRFLREMRRPIFALHPGSGSPSKNWPIENWLRLSEHLFHSDATLSMLLVGGEADQKELGFLRRRLPGKGVHLANNLPLPRLAALLAKCALYVGHDSGISHLAAAVGTPSVLLFGPSDPMVWAPRNPNVTVLRSPSGKLEDLSLEEVRKAVEARSG